MDDRKPTPLNELIRERLSRRDFILRSAAAATPILAAGCAGTRVSRALDASAARGGRRIFRFESLPRSTSDEVSVPEGYTCDVILRWGDPLLGDSPEFSLETQTAAAQARRFGFNCDFSAFFPLRNDDSSRGLIAVNHEYPRGVDMFPGYDIDNPTREQVDIEIASLGMSIAEIARDEDGVFRLVEGSKHNRRVTGETVCEITGPAAGDQLLRKKRGPFDELAGKAVRGTIANCAGGKTPWSTVLTAEENIQYYFGNADPNDESHSAYGLFTAASQHKWERYHPRFDVKQEPNEVNCFGWIVEIDPFDPEAKPKKRTALGRMRHEGAATGLADDGRVVVYTGDDERQQFVYKFVSNGKHDPDNREANRDLLDEGTLYAARLDANGRGEWLPLVPEGKLGDWSQAKILVHARLAAKLLGATPMDRPEDVEVNPRTRRVYATMTNDKIREARDHGPNPRSLNKHGHIIEFTEDGGDLAATTFTWTIFMLCGDPAQHSGTFYGGGDPKLVAAMSCPDNVTFDTDGNLWVATDGQPATLRCNDSLYAVPTFGPHRGVPQRFLNGPIGCEICGPEFTPDGESLFVCIQHPGELSGLVKPTSSWPDKRFARPSLIAVRRKNGGDIG